MAGDRCNFKTSVQNFFFWGGATPIKIWGAQTPNVVNQSRRTLSTLILGIGPENYHLEMVSKFRGFPPKNLRWGSKFRNFDIETVGELWAEVFQFDAVASK